MTQSRFVALFLLVAALPAQAAQFGIGQLMDALANNKHGAASFSEKKTISILDEPVESSGELLFVPPNRLEKRTLKPRQESLVLDGDVLSVERGRQKHVLQLKKYPEIAGMIESIRATLAGDRKALERVYHLTLTGGVERWSLVLIPLDAKVGGVVARIRIDGARDEVRTMEILLADGDRSVMTIRKIAAP